MRDARFISGPWTGFYMYRGDAARCRMDLALHFANGSLRGSGSDGVGRFVVSGAYDEAAGECTWVKTYPGSHDVAYRGFAEGKGIWGTWEISAHCRGGFHIWPRGRGTAEVEVVHAGRELVTSEEAS